MMFMTLVWLLIFLFLVRHLWSGDRGNRLPPGWVAENERELARLREEVERLGREVGRLNDEQSFMVRLLETREPPALGSSSEPGEPLAGPREDEVG